MITIQPDNRISDSHIVGAAAMRLRGALLLIIAGVWTVGGCGVDPDPRSEAEILSVGPIPPPAERQVGKCGDVVEATFRSDTVATDFDKVIGPRVEKWERVRGPRVRIAGTTNFHPKGGASIVGNAAKPFYVTAIDESKFGFEWPKELLGRRVEVEGCLSRIYYPKELQQPDTSYWKPANPPVVRNALRAWPFGFVYEIRNFEYRLKDDEAQAMDERAK